MINANLRAFIKVLLLFFPFFRISLILFPRFFLWRHLTSKVFQKFANHMVNLPERSQLFRKISFLLFLSFFNLKIKRNCTWLCRRWKGLLLRPTVSTKFLYILVTITENFTLRPSTFLSVLQFAAPGVKSNFRLFSCA